MWRSISLVASLVSFAHGYAITNQQTISEIVRLHNQARAEVGQTPIRWDPSLAQLAVTVNDNNCRAGDIIHTKPATSIGENLAANSRSAGELAEAAGATKLWIAEKSYYSIASNQCNGPNKAALGPLFDWMDCGHYTAIVWDDLAEVGCAISLSGCNTRTKGYAVYFACRYRSKPGGVAGNMQGPDRKPMRPYGRQGGPRPTPPVGTQATTPASRGGPMMVTTPRPSFPRQGPTQPRPPQPLPPKADAHPSCCGWAAYEECGKNPAWMLPNCPVACAVRGGRSDKSASLAYATANCGVYRRLYLGGVSLLTTASPYKTL